jgi:hypothetical protein
VRCGSRHGHRAMQGETAKGAAIGAGAGAVIDIVD